eukprot:m.804614 g.804614  ORF g.804614 m.804614 type:complete len:96 (+) comp23368_c0_seq41:447-734(+)
MSTGGTSQGMTQGKSIRATSLRKNGAQKMHDMLHKPGPAPGTKQFIVAQQEKERKRIASTNAKRFEEQETARRMWADAPMGGEIFLSICRGSSVS